LFDTTLLINVLPNQGRPIRQNIYGRCRLANNRNVSEVKQWFWFVNDKNYLESLTI